MTLSRITGLLCYTTGKSLLNLSAARQFHPAYLRLYSVQSQKASKSPVKENDSLLENLVSLGVDIKMVRRRQPGVLRKLITNEHGLARFLQGKGATKETVASIISRYPRAITRSHDHLEERWRLWRNIFKADSEIVKIVERSPESFFRSSDNDNLEKNIAFLSSLGLTSKDLHRLLTTAPRTFANSVELNRQMVELLQDVCFSLGGKQPDHFVKQIISRNVYILIRSTKRVRTNIEFLQKAFNLTDEELLNLLQGHGAEILDLSNEYVKRNFKSAEQKLQSLGCTQKDVKNFILFYPPSLYASPETLKNKIDCLLGANVDIKQILEKPRVLDFSIDTVRSRIKELEKAGYDFKKNGIAILDSSRKRFEAKLERLSVVPEE
ncbi:transcription termination factor 1, mitochondrial [Acipenser oxyrinchus oxyrinchus]|uniref:Transcription termination factor 1, mitochondrial n=1 Tax=Acipenser oxyrinchus oxyrinchus TaxID=40147 RepID=A0AAD8GFI7_ACIOX|nr:transcription termination factor 1, mitochondrial [Acipenser oxyrinchus oxyrinchus]